MRNFKALATLIETFKQNKFQSDTQHILKLKDEMDKQSSLFYFVVRKKWIMLVRDLGKLM
uniref:Uncharacterized protein n=1 Tax=Romanomermis culicivorax TaxID=13658 RepID=A0A915LAK6_ROMCU